MVNFQYNHIHYAGFLEEYARLLKTDLQGNTLVFPEQVARGFMRREMLPNGLELLISDFETRDDLLLERVGTESGYFSLRFDEVNISDCCILKLGEEVRQLCRYRRAGSLLRNTAQPMRIVAKSGTSVRGIYLMFSNHWLQEQVGITGESKLLREYFSLKGESLNLELWDAEYRRLVEEVLSLNNHPFSIAAIQNRVMMLVERFFTRLHYRLIEKRYSEVLPATDLSGIMAAEAHLMKDFGMPAPTISELARKAGMSPSKFKMAFKKQFGLPVYQYYLKHKMQKARELLLSGEYPVKEVGMMLGYSNLSHFAHAFRKETGCLPRELMN